ncbi:MAG: hypothetical protein HY817_01680 [Candidatus Abawacabacteria bacterium]|nr:hypothetical protein [Candidatus Abawacabacteria bacterium]
MTTDLTHLSTITNKIAKYFAVGKVNARNSKIHWPNMFARSMAVVLRVWLFAQLYEVTYAESGVTVINGFTVAMVVWSLMFAQSFDSASRPSPSQVIAEEVQNGTIAYSMSKPYSYISFHLWATVGRTLPVLLSNLIIGSLVTFILVGMTSITWQGMLLGSINLLLGYILDFSIALMIGLSALWLETVAGLVSIYHKARLVFSGLIVPVALFPDFFQKLILLSPFSQIYYSAAKQIVHFSWDDFFFSLSLQIFWIITFITISYIMFSYSLRRLSVNGG